MRQLFQNNRIFRNSLILLLFFIVVLILYYPVLKADPLWDDWFFLFRSKIITEGSILKYWSWGEYRRAWPAFYSIITLMYKLFESNYWLYRLVNIVLHVFNGFLIYKVIRLLKGNYAFLLSCIYLVHPLNFFTVSWIIQLKTLLSIFFFLLSLTLFIQNENEFSFKKYLVSVGLFALSLFSKTVFAPICLLGVFYSKKRRIISYALICLYTVSLTLWSSHIKPVLKMTDFLSPVIGTVISSEEAALPQKSRPMAPLKIKTPKFTFEDVGLSFKNFSRYSFFIISPSENFLVQKSTLFQYSTGDYLILFVTVFGTMFLIKKIVDNKKILQLMGLLFFIVTILPLCGFFYVPIFHYSNFVDYWLSVPVLGIVLMLSQMQYRKITYSVLVIIFVLFFIKTADVASKNNDPVKTLTLASHNMPENPLVKLILAKHYFYTGMFSKSNMILINVKKNYNLEAEVLDHDIEANLKAMNGEEVDAFTL